MAVDLLLLHTSDERSATFDRLRDDIAPSAKIEHAVRADWRSRALAEGMTWQLRREIYTFVQDSAAPVMTTCSTLGEAVELAGGIRADRAMMKAAAQFKGPVLLVCALESALEPSLALLEETMAAETNAAPVIPLVLKQFWSLYTSGDTAGFHAAIAAAVIEAIDARPDLGCIVLAQTTIAPVAHLLDGSGIPVLSAPELSMQVALSGHNAFNTRKALAL